MPGGFPIGQALSNANSLNSAYVLVTPSATINTKGSYIQITASTANDICLLWIEILYNPSVLNQSLVSIDVAIGGAGNEQIIIPDLVVDVGQQWGTTAFSAVFPLHIPAGTRISARSQVNVASGSNNAFFMAAGFDGEFTQGEGGAQVDAVGLLSAPIKGTNLTPSATANVKGAWAQLTASTAVDYAGFVLNIDMRGITGAATVFYVDVAVGAGGSEVIILSNFFVLTGTGSIFNPNSPYIGIPIPAGTRVAARCSSSVTSDTHTIGAALYAVYQ